MSDRRPVKELLQSVALRLLAILLLGWATILWFQGCLVPGTRQDIREEQQKSAGPEAPAHPIPRPK